MYSILYASSHLRIGMIRETQSFALLRSEWQKQFVCAWWMWSFHNFDITFALQHTVCSWSPWQNAYRNVTR